MTLTPDRPAVLVPRPLEELVDVSELDESGASDGDRRPAWRQWGVGAQPHSDTAFGPTSTWTERGLIAAYSRTAAADQPGNRVESCACGGRIQASDAPRAIAYAVERHNATPRHERWAIAQGMR